MADELVFTLSIKDNASPQIDAFTRKIKGLGQEAQKEFGAFRENFNKSFGDLGKPIQDINGLKTALSGLAGTGAAFAVSKAGDFIVDSVKNFAAYESALVSVQRTMGLTKTELDALGESLRTLALSELKGQVVADDLAVIAEVAGSLGVAKDDLIDFTKNVAMVATATDQSMEKVATSFGKIANVFKGSLGDEAYTKIGAIGSAFDKLADDMAATVPGMLNFVNRMGGVASSMGLTVDQTAALAATLESVGLPAERGATAMNNVMLTLMKNSKSFADALSIDAEKLASALKEKPVEALQMVLQAMEELGQTKGQDELLRVMEDLMGKGNGVTEVVLKMQGAQTDFAAALGKSKQAFDEATRAGESFNQSASTQQASWEAISTAIDDLSKSVGQQLQPTLNTLGTWLQTAATWWAQAFRQENVNAFFDWIVTAPDQYIVKPMQEGMQIIDETISASFADIEQTALAAVQKIKGVIDEIKGAYNDFKAAMSGEKSVSIGGFEKGSTTALNEIKNANIELIRSNGELKQQYVELQMAFNQAYANGGKPTQELVEATQRLKVAMADAGGETTGLSSLLTQLNDSILGTDDALEGHSLTPALRRYIEAALASGTATGSLTAEMQATMQGVLAADAAYKQLEVSLNQNQRAILEVEKSMQALKQASISASDFGKKQIAEELKGLQVKRSELMLQKKTIQEQMDLKREEIDLGKDAVKVFEDQQKAQEEAAKARIKAEEELQKNTERTADLRRKQQEDEMKAANDLYREQQKQAADSIKWVSDLDDATKKRILGEQDAVKVLQEQGVTLTDLQAQEVRRMQGAYKTEQAYEAQAKALEKQLGTSATLAENMSSLGNALSDIGGALNIEGLGDIGGGLSALSDAFKNIEDSFSGLKDGLAGMKNGFSGFLDGITSITGAVSALMSAWEAGKSIFEGISKGIKSLFKNTKSEGTEAAEAFQKFVAENVSGGAEMAAALKTNFHAMTAAGFDFQKFMQQTGTTMDQTFGGISQNWQTGTTAMDLFCQAVGLATGNMKKAPQVALQMMASFQDMGLSTEEAAKKMLEIARAAGMSEEQLKQLEAALANPIEVAVDVTAEIDLDTFNQEFEGLSSIVDDWSTRFKESGLEFWTPDEYTNEFDAITAKLEDLGAKGILSAEQIGAVSGVLKEITADGKVTAEELQRLEQAMRDVEQAAQAEIQPIEIPVIISIDPAAIEQSFADVQSVLAASAEFFTLNPTVEFQSFDDSGLAGMTAQLEALRNAGGLTQAQFTTLNDLLIKIGADGQVTAAEVQELNAAFTAAQATSAATTAALQDMSLTSDMATQAFNSLTAMLTTLQTNGSITDAQLQALGSSLQTIMADGQMTGLEMQNFAASLTAAGVPADQVSAQILKIAEAAGMSQAEIEALKAALAAGGAEGESTTAVFDAATQAATELAGTTQNLTGDVQTLTGTLAGAGSEGGDTTKIFTAASDAAKQLDSDSQTLSGDVSTLTQQLSGAGAETLATSNLFTMAGGSAAGLQGDVNNLDSQVATANASLAATQKALADIPNEKTVTFRVVTVGSPPRMATGGTIGTSGLAIVNERGSEIAHFPGGGMALMTAPGPTLGAFPKGTEIIPHGRSMELLSRFPGIPRMATGGTVGAMVAPVINITITGNNITRDTDLKALARQVSAEISRNFNATR